MWTEVGFGCAATVVVPAAAVAPVVVVVRVTGSRLPGTAVTAGGAPLPAGPGTWAPLFNGAGGATKAPAV